MFQWIVSVIVLVEFSETGFPGVDIETHDGADEKPV